MKWLGGIVATVVATVIATWLLGTLDQLVPSRGRAWVALKNLRWNKPQPSKDSFRIVLCWLEEDSRGDDTENVARAFTSIEGVTLVRSARIVKASGAADDWHETMQENAQAVLEDWNADLAVVGLVKKSKDVLSLWFVPRLGDGTLRRGDQPYELDKATLGSDFHDDLRTQLTVLALAAVAPLAETETRGQVLEKGLTEATEKLATLLESAAIDKPERRALLQGALGIALATLGERESGTARLEQAVEASRAALKELTRERVPLEWATTQNTLGGALWNLGERGKRHGAP